MRRLENLRAWGLLLLCAACGPAAKPAAQSDGIGNPQQPGDPGDPGMTTDGGVAGSGGSTPPGGKPGGGQPSKPGEPAMAPVQGATDFVSADNAQAQAANATRGAADSTAVASAAPSAGGAVATMRTVERGDIYWVLGEHRILNLNSYRGVQVIDVSDLSHPRIEGRLAVAGDPVELYVVDNRAFVLLNNWQGYYGSRDDVRVASVQGGLVMSVDLSDRTHPTLIDQAPVTGNISTSRLTQGGGQAALYVAATNYNARAEAVVKSFDVSDGKLTPKSEFNLGGSVQDIQATTDVLMVASQDYSTNQNRSQVSIIDISRPDGTMVKGGSVLAQGTVQNKFNMDAYKGVLRIVSGASWNGGTQNHLETFSLSDLSKLSPIAHCTFGGTAPSGQNEMLYATLFVENKAFFVTYYRKDPFHAFAIDDQGRCAEHSEFVVSGWNDFLRATLSNSRLIGVGRNDANSTVKLSVSLYDAANLSDPTPLLARADIDLSYGYSEASWDDRGFSVVEDAVSVKAADGTTETGLVLLPFEGYDQKNQVEVAQVQIFTYSDHTLTKRGIMDHGSPVRRSFETDVAGSTANLSEEQLSLFDTGTPDAPKEQGRLDLAPNYSELFVFGDYVARVKAQSYYFNWSSSSQSVEPPKSEVQILPRSADLDVAAPLTSFTVPANADLIQAAGLLVSVLTNTMYDSTGKNPPTFHSTIQVFDLSDPTQPKARGSFETDRIQPSYGGIYPLAGAAGIARTSIDCVGPCGGYYGGTAQHFVLGQAIAFVQQQSQMKSLGQVHQCNKYVNSPGCAVTSSGMTCPTVQYQGSIQCNTPAGGQESCTGSFYKCDNNGNCTPIADPPGVQTDCSDYEQFRYWQSYAFDALDLRSPDSPSLAPRLMLPLDEEGTSQLAVGTTLYFNYQQPYTMKGDPHSYVKHYVRLLDFGDPQKPVQGDAVNIPGEVIAVDGSTLYTRDMVWDSNNARTMVARLTLSGNLAHLQSSHLFQDRSVTAVQLDGAGHMLVSSDPVYNYAQPVSSAGQQSPAQHTLSILDAQSLDVSGEANVDAWATFKDAKQGRALFQVSGGLLVFDVSDASHPKAQAYFPTEGWPNEIYFDGTDILFAGGPYGVYRFDASVFNLLKM